MKEYAISFIWWLVFSNASPPSRHPFPEAVKEIRRVLIKVLMSSISGSRYRRRVRLPPSESHKTTPLGNAPKSYDNLVKYVWLGAEMFKNLTLSERYDFVCILMEWINDFAYIHWKRPQVLYAPAPGTDARQCWTQRTAACPPSRRGRRRGTWNTAASRCRTCCADMKTLLSMCAWAPKGLRVVF